MASQAPDVTSTCLICFETRLLKIVGNCNHSFCTECLSTALGSRESGSEVFACPSCKVDCPRPWDGVNGMLDYTGSSDDAADIDPVVAPEENETESRGPGTADVTCDICGDEDIAARAVNICPECDKIHLCQNCSKTHSKKKATRDHILTPIVTNQTEKEPTCEVHNKILISFCQTCGVQACGICVSVRHGDHEVERLGETIKSKVKDIRRTLKLREDKLKELQDLEGELTLLKAMAPVVDKQDILIKEIEDHAEKCMEQILKWKEDLKKQVKMDYKIIRDIPIGLENVSKEVQKLQEPIHRATQLLSKTEHHSLYLDKLVSLQQELEAIAVVGDKVKKEKECCGILRKVHSEETTFLAEQSNCSGQLHKKSNRKVQKSGIFLTLEQIIEHTVEGDSSEMFIPCVASLGHESYAVAHPTRNGEPSNAINIYDYSGTLKATFKDHVPPLYDMTATPDGKLAVLSDGAAGPSRSSVKVFDPETGYIGSTCDISIKQPISLGVTLKEQYVILGANDMGQTEIAVVSKTGNKESRYAVQETDNIEHPNRITCGGRFIFGTGVKNIAVYEIRNTGLPIITTTCLNLETITDITATIWDEIFLTDFDGFTLFLNKFQDKENKLELNSFADLSQQGQDKEARVSTRDGLTVVVSFGLTVRVYKCH